ncbi:MAG TPA: Hsp20/alpha crystallin family protein [Anaerolineaceae bacterium]|nr:Hsp20/alpha crystallin family protein [Anaerolineaceae bacterium]
MLDNTKIMAAQKKEAVPSQKSGQKREQRVYLPRTDIYEDDEAIFVVADIPGADEKSTEITLEKNVLSIHASPVYEIPEKLSLVYAEYGVGDYQRSFTLSDQIDRENIQASVKNGVLSLRLPKAGPVKAQKITVKSE